ncbi:MAG: MarR family winged helix-turn-helix transcriptional regulator [Polyangia bacterium]
MGAKRSENESDRKLWLLLDEQLCFALYSANLAMSKVYRKLLGKLGVTYPQYLVLLILWEHDGLTVSDIGARLFLDSATLTPLLKRMEVAGLLSRHRGADDERQVIVTLTKKGRELKQIALSVPADVLCATGCTPNELAVVRRELKKLRAALLKAG